MASNLDESNKACVADGGKGERPSWLHCSVTHKRFVSHEYLEKKKEKEYLWVIVSNYWQRKTELPVCSYTNFKNLKSVQQGVF